MVDLLREQVGAGRWTSQVALAAELGCSQATVSRDLAHLQRLLSEKANSLPLLMGGWPVLYCLLAGWGFTLTGRGREERSLPGEPTHLLTKVYLPRRDRRRRRDPKSPTLARELLVCPPPTNWYGWLEWLEAA
ncbi:MAG: hypothetical protein OXH85_05065 [Truepera sp.]|nr:hypothetical protein [Truepera sp.]